MSNKLYRATDRGWSNDHRKMTALGILAGVLFVVGMVIGTTTDCYGSEHNVEAPCGNKAKLMILERALESDPLNKFYRVRLALFRDMCRQVTDGDITLKQAKHVLADMNNILVYIEHNDLVPREITALRWPLEEKDAP